MKIKIYLQWCICAVFAFCYTTVQAQQYSAVAGKVLDGEGNVMPGVGVSVKDAGHKLIRSIASNENGLFAFDGLEVGKKYNFSFSYTGFAPYLVENFLITAGEKNSLLIRMEPDQKKLNEVVVVGYGTQKKANLTGAVSTIKMDDVLGNRPVTNTGNLLQGTIPGLEVATASGAPGATPRFNIRGATDITPNSSNNLIQTAAPFILIDNVPFNGPLNLIDPNDIENVTVLKDAGSAAIYGARSAFGVILITTKKGTKNQKPSLNYSNNLTLSKPTELPIKATVLQTIQSYKDMGTTGYWTGQDVDTWLDLAKRYEANPSAFPLGYEIVNGTRYSLEPTDALADLLGKSARQFMHNFSVSGGAEKTTYRFSAGTVSENGIIVPDSKQDNFKRYNLKSFITTEVKDWLSLQLDAAYYNSIRSTPASTGFAQSVSYAPYTDLSDSLDIDGVMYISGKPKTDILQTSPTTNRYDDTRLTGRVILTPFKRLKITGEYTYDNLRSLGTSYDKKITFAEPRRFVASTGGAGVFAKLNEITDYNALNIFANYDQSFKKHNLSLLAGYNQEESSFEQERVQRDGIISANNPSISQATGVLTGVDNYSEYAVLGAFGRINYNYEEKYLLGITGRYDASSKFPKNHRSGFFPSFSAGWSLDKEPFMQWTSAWLSQFKPRVGFGSVGNQNISAYAFLPTMDASFADWLVDQKQVTTLSVPGLVSSDFTWATVQTLNFGLDVSLFKNRLSLNFDWFRRDTKDLLYEGIQFPAVLGTNAPLQNVAALRSKGFELQINWQHTVGKVGYKLSANLADYRSSITKIKNENGLLSQYYEGQQLGEIWGYTTDRLFTTDDFIAGSLNESFTGGTLKPGIPRMEGQLPNPGDVMFIDRNGDGVINAGSSTLGNPGDRTIIGNNAPRYQFGFSGSVNYKNFDFSFTISGVAKQDQWRANLLTFPNFYAFGTLYADQLDYWTPTNQNSYWGRTYDQAKGNQDFNQSIQTKYLMNGANLRIRNLTLGYTIPTSLSKKLLVDRFQTFFSVENAFTFDHMPKGLDPDLTVAGQQGYQYPFMRLYSIGVNLTF